jgi:hypothetical protein
MVQDRLLWHKYVKADYAVKDGSHAMIVFRAEEINKIIESEALPSSFLTT